MELQRLGSLYDHKILDTERESPYTEVVGLASLIAGAPIALVSLVAADRQWFKDAVGIEVKETPRSVSFCSHAIERDEPLWVPDATQDPRFKDNPLVVSGPEIRSYYGIPLASRDGFRLGTLCVIDNEPRAFNDFVRGGLGLLAKQLEFSLKARLEAFEYRKRIAEFEEESRFAVLGKSCLHIANEMNVPLVAMKLRVEQLDDYLARGYKLPIALEERLEEMRRLVEKVTSLAASIRSLGEAGEKSPWQTLEVEQILNAALAVCSPRFDSASTVLKIVRPVDNVEVRCRGQEISQVLVSLLQNALEAVERLPENRRWVEVSTELTPSHLRIQVVDAGDGIAPEVLNQLFRVSTNAKPGSSGLGLLTARTVAESHGASLYLSDPSGAAGCFILEMPRADLD